MHPKPGVVQAVLVGLVLLAGAGCSSVSSVISTGARSVFVVFVRQDVSAPAAAALDVPPREEVKPLFAGRFLWLADSKRAAQWIAYVDVRPPVQPLLPYGLTLLEVRKNPDWRPAEFSDPPGIRDNGTPLSFKLAEQNEERERSIAGSSR